MKRLLNYALLAGLTGAAVWFGAGCDPITDDPVVNQFIYPVFFGTEVFNVCVPSFSIPGLGQHYTRYTVAVNPDGSTHTIDSDSGANRGDCDYSVDTSDQVDPSARQAAGFGQGGQGGPGAQVSGVHKLATGASPYQPVDALPYARPVPFMPSSQAPTQPPRRLLATPMPAITR